MTINFDSNRLVQELKLIYAELNDENSSRVSYTYIVNYIIFRIVQDTGCDMKYSFPDIKFNNDILKKIHATLDISRYNFKTAIDNNLLGRVYEEFLDIETRKLFGLYYTPDDIINFILENSLVKADVLENPFVKVLDPSCGSGYFLLSAYDILKEKFKANVINLKIKYSDEIYSILKNGKTLWLKGGEYWCDENIHYHIIKNCIYGADIDEFGVMFTINSLIFKDFGGLYCNPNIVLCNSLVKWEKQSEESQADLTRFWSNKFDFIVGNPPWVSLSRKYGQKIPVDIIMYYKENYSGNTYLPNLYDYFLERSLEIIKKGGYIGFLIPDRFAKNRQFLKFRKYILERYNIKHILFGIKLSNIIVDSMVLVIENSFSCYNKIEVSILNNGKFYNIQKDLLNSSDFQFVSYSFDYYKNIFEKFKTGALDLKGIALSFTGFIGINQNITDKKMHDDQVPVIKGVNIKKYGILGNKFYDIVPSNIIGGTKNVDKLKAKNKILVRKTGSKIIAAIDDSGYAIEQSLYGIIVKNKEFRVKYVLAILNSKLMEWYYLKFLVTNINSTPQLKKINLDQIPIKYCSAQRQLFIENLVDRMGGSSESEVQELQGKIDEEIFDIYGIKIDEIQI